MENNTSLIVDNISVRYRKQDSRSTADIIKRIFKKSAPKNEFWALRNISFTLEKGDMLGVIGRNGAGKSTMMKAISGTLMPASGEIKREGKLCALLELATGFDREMTVKENIYLRGAFLGYSKEFIDSKYDEIIDFADMREFEDNPFRTLSSGMKSRVAFAIASMVKPDIIILDEVFAVGDGDFRKKSQQRMQEIIGSGETTALIVSHSLDSVRRQCNKVLWLNKGRMVMFGDPETVCNAYSEFLKTKKLPETESLKAVQENPVNRMKKSKGRILGEALVYLLLLVFAATGVFYWSQHDLFRSLSISKDMQAEEILAAADRHADAINSMLDVDTSGWSDEFIDECAAKVDGDDMTLREAAKEILAEAGGSAGKHELAAAELETVRHIYADRVEKTLGDIKDDYSKLPEDSRKSLMLYTYSHFKSLCRLEKQYDDDMRDVIDEISAQLQKDGLPESCGDELMSIWKAEKIYMIAYYIDSLS